MILAAREEQREAILDRMAECAARCSNGEYFARLCHSHKVGPLVLQSLALLNESANPGFLHASANLVRTRLHRHWAHRQVHAKRLIALTRDILGRTGTPFAFLRGLPFAEQFYLNPALRVYNDVDVLIPESFRDQAMKAFLDAGFRWFASNALQRSRIEYEGQVELSHPDLPVLLDVNWLLTGNVGIGKVETDVARIWERATAVGGGEHRLSNEDVILNMVRHVGHGHDFEHGSIQCCADVTAVLRACGRAVHWAYVCNEAGKCECLRIMRFFAFFYDRYYRDESMAVLSELLGEVRRYASDAECSLFARTVQAPLVRRKVHGKTTTEFICGNICFAGKLWALDRLGRLLKIVLLVPWPSKHEVVLLTLESHSESLLWRRVRYYFNPLLPGLPGLCFGIMARLTVGLAHRVGDAHGWLRSFFVRE